MSKAIEALKESAQKKVKKKGKHQIKTGFVLLLVLCILGAFIFSWNVNFGLYWFFGILLGFILQRVRFCFAAGFRDPVLVGSTSLIRAILIAIFISTLGFAWIQYNAIKENPSIALSSIPGAIYPVGFGTVLGAILFGIGMVVAGGCASGTLMRIGEGFMMQSIVLLGFLIGTLWGAHDFGFWNKLFISKSPIIYLPHYFGFWQALLMQGALLILLYYLSSWYDKNNNMMHKL
ncbi:MAG: YeeE/YedE thiosulfate transporter family protein [Thermotaleaceae bacterium]